MKIRIHFTVYDMEDYFDLEGETIEEIKRLAQEETERRGLNEEENHLWSEQL